jgi:hypothetical protein
MIPVISSEIGVNVKIEWIAPNSGSLAIEKYLIEILTSDTSNGETYIESQTCDGSDEYIISNLFCTVSMSELTSAPFSIAQGELIEIRVSAMNSLGFGIASTLNTQGVFAK